MSDSVDRVFVHALQTVRRLPRTGSSRPPPDDRLRLYGLYKQSMEGDVAPILNRPTLPPSSPDPLSTNVHRYASRDLRVREVEAEQEKWDAWNQCKGLSRTEAKRAYIESLIQTMKKYANATLESRELVEELEFVWAQIRSQSGSEQGLELGSAQSLVQDGEASRLTHPGKSSATVPPGGGRTDAKAKTDDGSGSGVGDQGRLRVLSPVSGGRIGDIVESEDIDAPDARPQGVEGEDDEDEEDEFHDSHEGSQDKVPHSRGRQPPASAPNDDVVRHRKWRRRVEEALTEMTAEIAALRERMADSRVFGTSAGRKPRLVAWMKWLLWSALRHAAINVVLVALLVFWGKWKGDKRAEEWTRRRWRALKENFFAIKWRPWDMRSRLS